MARKRELMRQWNTITRLFCWDEDDECWRYGAVAIRHWHGAPWMAELQDRSYEENFPILSATGQTAQKALDALEYLVRRAWLLHDAPLYFEKLYVQASSKTKRKKKGSHGTTCSSDESG